jgi:hypothetical protein
MAWRLILGRSYSRIGGWPLAVGYMSAIVGLLAASFVLAGAHFDWMLFLFVGIIGFAFSPVSFVGVPIAALLLRIDRLNFVTAALLVVLALLVAGALYWTIPTNIDLNIGTLQQSLVELAIFVVPATSAFFIGLTASIRIRE